jgi:hypothetical protein
VTDYVSPGLERVDPSVAFPDIVRAPPGRRSVYSDGTERVDPHSWYHDQTSIIGFVNVDEAHLLYNNALQFEGKLAIEIGCASGYSSWHILKAGMRLTICDPVLSIAAEKRALAKRLAEFPDRVEATAVPSPAGVLDLGARHGAWAFAFIDANHDAPYPMIDAVTVQHFAAPDAIVMFHDCLGAPGNALFVMQSCGWHVGFYNTSQLMGIAWRGTARPVRHVPDPALVEQPLPPPLRDGCAAAALML